MPRSQLLRELTIKCKNCGLAFKSKDLRVKYCCRECRDCYSYIRDKANSLKAKRNVKNKKRRNL